jgi:hypothetical protein
LEKIEVLLSHSKTIIIIVETMTEAAVQMKNVVFEVMDKYAFIEEYLNAPSVLTGKGIPIFIKYMSTILYLRRRLGFLVVPDDEMFYDKIEDNDYTQFAAIDDVEIYKILVAFVIFSCSYVTSKVEDDDESLNNILPNIRKYIYKNLDFVVPELA